MLTPFKFWCSKVLPLVYDDSLSYYELLNKVVLYLNHTMEDVNNLSKIVSDFINSGIVEEEVAAKLDEMVEDGTMDEIINQELFSELNQRIDNLEHKKILVFGDSYCTVGGSDDKTIVDYCRTYLGLDSSEMINHSVSGFGYWGGVGKWSDLVLTVATGMTEDAKNAVSDVIFIGGRNDAQLYAQGSRTIADLLTARNAAFENSKTSFPNAKIHSAFIGRNTNGGWFNEFSEVLSKVYKDVQDNGADYYSGIENVFTLRKLANESDNNHPNDDGQKAIARALAQCIINGSVSVMYPSAVSVGSTSSAFTVDVRARESLYDGICKVVFKLGSKTFETPIASGKINGATAYPLCSFENDNNHIFLTSTFSAGGSAEEVSEGIYFQIPVICSVNAGDGNYFTDVICTLQVYGNSLYAYFKKLNAAGTDYLTASINSVQFPNYLSVDIPMWIA